MYSYTAEEDPELTMNPKPHGVEICLDKVPKMICSYGQDIPVFVTVENDPQFITDLDSVIYALFGETALKRKIAIMALFCLMLFEALSLHENNLKLGASQ
jgi:hypothetical protein